MPFLPCVNPIRCFNAATTNCLIQLLVLLLALTSWASLAKEPSTTIQIASAANFRATLEQLTGEFSKQHEGIVLNISSGSTGALYEQIIHGAPYDLYFAADQKRPRLLIDKNLAVKSSLFDYAKGQLTLLIKKEFADAHQFSCNEKKPLAASKKLAALLMHADKIIIANPRIAPYGSAAREFLRSMENNMYSAANWTLINAKNVLHAQQLFQHTQAPVAIVSLAQLRAQHQDDNTINCKIAASAHRPIIQSAVIIKRGTKPQASTAKRAAIEKLWHYLHSSAALSLLQQQGYAPATSTTDNR